MTTATEQKYGTVEERVAKGAAWLDENHDGWIEEVELDRLDLGSECNCVLGQIVSYQSEVLGIDGAGEGDDEYNEYEVYLNGFEAVCVENPAWVAGRKSILEGIDGLSKIVLTTDEARSMGFHLLLEDRDAWFQGKNQAWEALTTEWERTIIERRARKAAL